MWSFADLLENFFRHKDFLPDAHLLPGTLFTPLHLFFSLFLTAAVLLLSFSMAKKNEKQLRRLFLWLWGVLVILEIAKIAWESCSGETIGIEWQGVLPLYPCSIFLYALPFAAAGRGPVRRAACGYICSLGLVGGIVNFVYPANILGNYSCISFAGFHTFLYHGAIVFCALTMLRSGYHTYTDAASWRDLFIPSIPFLAVSVVANLVNFSPIDSDYMFFKLESFIFAPLGRALPDLLSILLVYAAYLLIHALPYIPFFIRHRMRARFADRAENPS